MTTFCAHKNSPSRSSESHRRCWSCTSWAGGSGRSSLEPEGWRSAVGRGLRAGGGRGTRSGTSSATLPNVTFKTTSYADLNTCAVLQTDRAHPAAGRQAVDGTHHVPGPICRPSGRPVRNPGSPARLHHFAQGRCGSRVLARRSDQEGGSSCSLSSLTRKTSSPRLQALTDQRNFYFFRALLRSTCRTCSTWRTPRWVARASWRRSRGCGAVGPSG